MFRNEIKALTHDILHSYALYSLYDLTHLKRENVHDRQSELSVPSSYDSVQDSSRATE